MIYDGLVVFRVGKAKSFISDDIVQNSKQSDTKNNEKNDRTSAQIMAWTKMRMLQ